MFYRGLADWQLGAGAGNKTVSRSDRTLGRTALDHQQRDQISRSHTPTLATTTTTIIRTITTTTTTLATTTILLVLLLLPLLVPLPH